MAASSSQHGGGSAVKGCECQKCAGQRLKWRNKKFGAALPSQPVASTGKVVPVFAPAQSPMLAAPLAPAPVPWVAVTLVPVLSQAVNLVEKADVASLAEEAGKIHTRCAELVTRKGGWPEAAKATLVTGGASLCAKYLNRFGVSAEYQPEIEVGVAALAIMQSRASLREELRVMAKEMKDAVEKAAAQAKAA